MEKIYLVIVIVLFLLAISDLIVGVSNDAVNFLNSAIGSKAAPLRIILIVAAAGILVGGTFSNGMMEVARKGIFNPGAFKFENIMIIFLAVMLTDIILLDLFNTFGLPTSTTVSIVFELLGASVGIAVLNIMGDSGNLNEMANYINSGKALAIISGILLSVVVAFTTGALVQYLSRMLFTFKFNKTIKVFGAVWGGLAVTAITYFILIKGAKGSSLINKENLEWIKTHTLLIIGVSFVAWTLVLQILTWIFKINILKLTVMVGTFALAMAFAGNDLVNFIGVPLAGFESYKAYVAAGGGAAESMLMGVLSEKVETPTLYLLIAGLIMVITLWLSKKAKSVVKTSLNLSDQEEVNERFESSGIARSLVRQAIVVNKSIRSFFPKRFLNNVDKRFDSTYFTEEVSRKEGVSFDLVRASVNLVVASILIAIGTSLKLPLSTTYVTFMVAMGTSLADGAWDRESAVYRITGVVTVVGGWFFTALSAFTVSLIVALILAKTGIVGIFILIAIAAFVMFRTHALHKKKAQEEATAESSELTVDGDTMFETCSNNIVGILLATSKSYDLTIHALIDEKRKKLKETLKSSRKLNEEAKNMKKNIPATIKKLKEEFIDSGHHYIEVIDYAREAMHSLNFIVEPCYKHVDNNHKPLVEFHTELLFELNNQMQSYLSQIIDDISKSNYYGSEERVKDAMELIELISKMRKRQVKVIKKEAGSTRNNLLVLDTLNETKNLVLYVNNMYKSFRDFSEENKNHLP